MWPGSPARMTGDTEGEDSQVLQSCPVSRVLQFGDDVF